VRTGWARRLCGGRAEPVLAHRPTGLSGGRAGREPAAVHPTGQHVRPALRPARGDRRAGAGGRGRGCRRGGAALMRRTAQAVLLLLLGGMMLKLVVTGSYDRYVRGVHAPLLAVAGVGLVVIAVATLWRSLSRSLRSADEPGVDEAD